MGSQDLQQARYDQLVRRVGGLYGGGSKVTEVLPEMFPVLELEDTTPELLALTGWRMAWQSTVRASGAGNVSRSMLFNPAGSGQLVAITQLVLESTVANVIQAEIQAAQFGTAISGLFRDARFGVPRSTVAQASSQDGGTTVGGGLRITISANTAVFLRDDNGIVVLVPGTGLAVSTVSNQTNLTVNYFWRERLALESEINFP